MKKTTVWRVRIEAENYSTNETFLVAGDSAAVAEKKAMGLAAQWDEDLTPGEKKHRPYVRNIELVGDLDA